MANLKNKTIMENKAKNGFFQGFNKGKFELVLKFKPFWMEKQKIDL